MYCKAPKLWLAKGWAEACKLSLPFRWYMTTDKEQVWTNDPGFVLRRRAPSA